MTYDDMRRAVLTHLQGGKTYDQALSLAQRPEIPPLGNRKQPQSPAHVSRAAVAAGLRQTGVAATENWDA